MGQLTIFGETDLQPEEVAERYLDSVRGVAPVTVTSVSGGKSSAYTAIHHPTDYYVFACVLSDDPRFTMAEGPLKDEIRERLPEFNGSHELPQTLANILWLEGQIGKPIKWLAAQSFDQLIAYKKALPNSLMRFCTEYLKMKPIYDWQRNMFGDDMIEMSLGIRADEPARVFRLIGGKKQKKADGGGWDFSRLGACERVPGSSHRREDWRFLRFPLYEAGTSSADVIRFFQKNPPPLCDEFSNVDGTHFPKISNCRFCFFHRPAEQREQAALFPDSVQWVHEMETTIGHSFGKKTLDQILKGEVIELFGENDGGSGCLCL